MSSPTHCGSLIASRRLLRLAGTVATAFSALLAAAVGALDVPFLVGRVNDHAQMIPPPARARLEQRLASLEQATGAQLAILTVDSLEGEVLEDFSLKVAETWKLGGKERDDGLLLLIARRERKMRLEVGYGLEARLPDVACNRIINNILQPRFRQGQFGPGIEEAVAAIGAALKGEAPVAPEAAPGRSELGSEPLAVRLAVLLFFGGLIGLFSLVAVFTTGFASWLLYFFLMPFYLIFPALAGAVVGFLILLAWVIGFPVAKILLRRKLKDKGFLRRHPRWAALSRMAASSGRSGGSAGSWSSGGGFSGGGGSFGG
ncbi:MAG: TPM domain-containing protein, partial [Acidobacteriota bacterium]